MPVITMLNQKGGVGKTSTCYHLAGVLAQQGRRVLLVDNDPQASLTQGFWGPEGMLALRPEATIAAVYDPDVNPFPDQVIRPSGFVGIDLLPGSERATRHNVPEPERLDPLDQACLRDFLGDLRGAYDLILIDCPPNLHLCSWAALVASDAIIVPLQPEDFGAQGLGPVQDSIARVAAGPNPGLALLGYLIMMFNARRSVHKVFDDGLREQYGGEVFETRVPDLNDYAEAVTRRQPVSYFKPRGAAAKTMKLLADEVLARIDSRADRTTRGAA
jgi:chromosome partitioning protein